MPTVPSLMRLETILLDKLSPLLTANGGHLDKIIVEDVRVPQDFQRALEANPGGQHLGILSMGGNGSFNTDNLPVGDVKKDSIEYTFRIFAVDVGKDYDQSRRERLYSSADTIFEVLNNREIPYDQTLTPNWTFDPPRCTNIDTARYEECSVLVVTFTVRARSRYVRS